MSTNPHGDITVESCGHIYASSTQELSTKTIAPNSATTIVICPPRERTTMLVTMAVSFLAALWLCVAAWIGVTSSGVGGGGGNDAYGAGTPGSGGGSGTGTFGDGPGAGLEGNGRGRDGVGQGLPEGVPDGVAAATTPETIDPAADAETAVEPPHIGFTVPDAPAPVVTQPVAPPPSGVPGGDGSSGASGKGGGGTDFMGVHTDSKRVVYVIDHSGSMDGDKLNHTKLEIRRSIEKLPETGAFLIVYFNTSPLAMPPGAMVPANKRNKIEGIKWMREQVAGGGTDPSGALEIALQEPRPDSIYLMTDGIFYAAPVLEVLERLNADHKVVVNTIGFHSQDAEELLKRIAKDNQGTYRYVAPLPAANP